MSVALRDRISMGLMILLGLFAFAAFLNAWSSVQAAAPVTVIVEMWRMLGFLVFAGLFGILAFYPRQVPGLWELVFVHKAGMAVFSANRLTEVFGAKEASIVDGFLAFVILLCYVLAKGYTSWSHKPRNA